MAGPILVTGANGFLARHLLEALKGMADWAVVGTDVHAQPRWGEHLDGYEAANLTSPPEIEAVLRTVSPTRVFHLAGLNGGTAWDMFSVNTLGTVGLLEGLGKTAPNASVVVIGSAAEYGLVDDGSLPVRENHPCRPVGAYGVSKHAATLAALDYASRTNARVMVARLFNIVGAGISRNLVVGAFLERARLALAENSVCLRVPMGRLDTKRDYLAADDAARGCVQLMEHGAPGDVVNVCSGRWMEVADLVRTLCSFSPVPISTEVSPGLVRGRDVPAMYGDTARARALMGFSPRTPIESALRSAWEYAMASSIPR